MCRQLLVSKADTLLNSIPAVITVGAPLEGARVGNWFLRQLPFLSTKIKQLANEKTAFDNYKSAIRDSLERKVRRQKHLHIVIEDDQVINPHVEENYTVDDQLVAAIPGTHRDFATDENDAAYVAKVLLVQLRKQLTAMSRPSIRKFSADAESTLPDRLLIIACSHQKRDDGTNAFQGPPQGCLVLL